MATVALEIDTGPWAERLCQPARYKGAKGGRGSGKSHFFAESVVLAMLEDPALRVVCIREVQRSLKFSAKSLIEGKIRALGLQQHFDVLTTEIRRRGGTGLCIFEGMQDHTADSLKSLEGFRIAWVEEAQSLSKRSLDLLLPTIRMDGSEIWFSWNPDQPDDPVDDFLVKNQPANAVVVHVNYLDNPFCPETTLDEANRMLRLDPDAYEHIWLGGYNVKSEAKVLHGKWRVDEFEPQKQWDGPYHGLDFGFSQDPMALVRCWLHDRRLYIDQESWAIGLELDASAAFFARTVTDFDRYVIRADAAAPQSIAHLRTHGVPKIQAAPKWSGSVEDGIRYLRQFEEIVIHPRCTHTIEEARLYSYKVDKHTGDVLPQLEDRHNHLIDSIRYALSPFIKPQARLQFI